MDTDFVDVFLLHWAGSFAFGGAAGFLSQLAALKVTHVAPKPSAYAARSSAGTRAPSLSLLTPASGDQPSQ